MYAPVSSELEQWFSLWLNSLGNLKQVVDIQLVLLCSCCEDGSDDFQALCVRLETRSLKFFAHLFLNLKIHFFFLVIWRFQSHIPGDCLVHTLGINTSHLIHHCSRYSQFDCTLGTQKVKSKNKSCSGPTPHQLNQDLWESMLMFQNLPQVILTAARVDSLCSSRPNSRLFYCCWH